MSRGNAIMKKNNRGFIATSLIYSFFLVFLAVLLAILSNYIISNRILASYNRTVKDKLNNKAYDAEIYAKGIDCYVQVGVSNLVLQACFDVYNLGTNSPVAGDDYECFFTQNANPIYNTSSLSVSGSPYNVTCLVRNKNVDLRFNASASTNIYVVQDLREGNNS